MQRLREDIKASTSSTSTASDGKAAGTSGKNQGESEKVENGRKEEGEKEDANNLAFVSPLVDGRLVDIARQEQS